MANYLYVDYSNIWIEGMHLSAVKNGLASDINMAIDHKICDTTFKLDFGRLIEFAGGKKSEIGRAVLFGSRPPPNDSIWELAKKKGFEVVVYDRNSRNKEKKIDVDISTEIVMDALEKMKAGKDEITLVAGDADYVPAVEKMKRRGFTFEVLFWGHAANELKKVSSKFVNLNSYLDHLRYK
jgi:uncharacterized LabA/DUF88 family protein